MLYINTAVTSFISLLLLFVITKILGNKQISELNMFDYINGITIGSIAAEMATESAFREISVAATAIIVYGAVGLLISLLTLKSIRCRHFVSGREIILMKDGKIYPDSIKRARLDVNDLLTKARINGYYNISDISYAILENNGEISFLPKGHASPATRSDILPMVKSTVAVRPPVYVIIDGKVLEQNLRSGGKDDIWLSRSLKENGLGSPSEAFLAYIDETDSLVVHKKVKGEVSQDIFS